MPEYTLPNIVIRGDTFSIKFVNASVGGLTVPSICRLINVGELSEQFEGKPNDFSKIEPENIDLEFRDTGKFFEQLLAGTSDVELKRNGEFVFVGTCLREIEMEEYYVSGSDARHDITITCISKLASLRDVSFENVISELTTLMVGWPTTPANRPKLAIGGDVIFRTIEYEQYVHVHQLFHAIMTAAFMPGNVPFSIFNYVKLLFYFADVPYEDLRYHYNDYTYGGLNNLLINTYCLTHTEYANYFGKKYKTALDFLIGMCKTFAFIPRLTYAPFVFENNTYYQYKLTLMTRRRINYTPVDEPINLITSKKKKLLQPVGVRFFHNNLMSGDIGECYVLKGTTSYFDKSPDDADFEVDVEVLWVAAQITEKYWLDDLLCFDDGVYATMKFLIGLSRYNYATQTWTPVLHTYPANESLFALLEHFKYNFRTDKVEYERVYKGITNNKVGDVFTLGNKGFYINGLKRNFMEKEEEYKIIEY